MALNERDMRAEMQREITVPGEPAIPLTYPITWSGPNSSPSTKGNTKMANDVGGLEALLGQVAEFVMGNSKEIASKRTQQATLGAQTADSVESLIPTRISLETAKSNAALESQTASIQARNLLENNPGDPNSLYAALTQEFVASSKQALQQRQAIAEKKQVGLFDNPIEWLVNAVTLPDEIIAMKATQGKADQARATLAEMQSLTTASAQAQKATEKTLSEQLIAQQQTLLQGELQANVNKLRVESLSHNVEALKALNEGNAYQVEAKTRLLNAQNQAQQLVLSQSADTRASVHAKRVEDAYAQDEAAQNEIARQATIGAALRGQKSVTYEEVKNRLKTKDPRVAAQVAEWSKAGREWEEGVARSLSPEEFAEAKASGDIIGYMNAKGKMISSSVGATPGRAIVSLGVTGGLDAPEYSNVKSMLERLRSAAEEEVRATGTKPTDPRYQTLVANKVDELFLGSRDPKTGKPRPATGRWYQEAQNVETEGNMFRMPEFSVLAAIPAVQKSPLYQTVVVPAVAAGVKHPDISYLIQQGQTAGMKNEQIALGISELVKASQTAAWSSVLNKFSIPYQSKYIVKMPSMFGISESFKDEIDWANPAIGAQYLNLLEVKKDFSQR